MFKDLFDTKNLFISILAVVAVGSYFIVENTMILAKQDFYHEKIIASEKTKAAFEYLKKQRFPNAEFIDNINDPNETALIGERYSQITTGSGSLPIKASTINPNCAAMIIDMLKEVNSGNKGDIVAVCMTGSFPALDIATLISLETLGIQPIVVVSTTSSSWGANAPNFNILDMIRSLQKGGFINTPIKHASIGGNSDIGVALSERGRTMVLDAIERNNFILLNDSNLLANIKDRIEIIDRFAGNKKINAFINIGGGVASLGSGQNGVAVSSGVNSEIMLKNIPDKYGVLFEMASRKVPIIHLLHLEKLLKKYDLPLNPVPLPKVGVGGLYFKNKYNISIVITATILLVGLILFFAVYNNKKHKLGSDIVSEEIEI